MNNESENERIDLTKFEGMVEGPWIAGLSRNTQTFKETGVVRNEQWQLIGEGWNTNKPTLLAVAAVPDLIAELKRCYEELDKWTYYATYIENVDMDCHKDASAEAGFLWKCTDCGAHFELPENGIYECEFGCDASE